MSIKEGSDEGVILDIASRPLGTYSRTTAIILRRFTREIIQYAYNCEGAEREQLLEAVRPWLRDEPDAEVLLEVLNRYTGGQQPKTLVSKEPSHQANTNGGLSSGPSFNYLD